MSTLKNDLSEILENPQFGDVLFPNNDSRHMVAGREGEKIILHTSNRKEQLTGKLELGIEDFRKKYMNCVDAHHSSKVK
ncbi:MAG: hypothetical protein WC806_04270 [Candidatus Gracilibacteria bacterium]|jgi:hypothetical protein